MPKNYYEPSTQEWFNDFLHGKISPTDIVLSPVERRILPSFNSPLHASDNYPSWVHADCGVGFEYETSPSSLLLGNRLAFWLRTEPTMNSNGKRSKRFMKVGSGANFLFSAPSSSILRSGVFVDIQNQNFRLNDMYSGACFVSGRSNNNNNNSNLPSPEKWQVAFQTGTHHSSTQHQPSVVTQRSALAFAHWSCYVPWWLGGKLLYNPNRGLKNSMHITTVTNQQKTSGGTSSSETTSSSNSQHQQQQQDGKVVHQLSSSSSNQEGGTQSNSTTTTKSEQPVLAVASWYASASYQQDPSFVMIRFNAAIPVSPYSEFSIGSDPLRRFHAALCTHLSQYVDCGMRLRLNTISWQDAGLDVGAMINLSSIMRGGLPKQPEDASPSIRLGIQSVVGKSAHVFADIFKSNETIMPSSAEESASSSSSSSLSFGSFFKNVQIGFGFSKFHSKDFASGRSIFGRYGMDTFIKCEF